MNSIVHILGKVFLLIILPIFVDAEKQIPQKEWIAHHNEKQ